MSKKTLTEVILESFGGSRNSGSFKGFTDEEFTGYVAGMVNRDNLNRGFGVTEVITEVRRLVLTKELY